MMSQPRRIGGPPQYQPSQSQPIPTRFTQPQQFGSAQANSPRHVSSSPHQQYFQPGLSPHDMYKGAPGMAGTPPTQAMTMSPQTYFTNGQRPKMSMQPMQNSSRPQYYYPQMPPRFQNTMGPPQTPSSAPFYSNVQQQSPYQQYQLQPVPPISNQPHSMYSPGYPTPYGPPPPQQHMVPAQPPMPQLQQSGERKKRLIQIKDPNTKEDVTADVLSRKKSDLPSTPSSGRSSATPPTTDVAAKFAAQVAAVAGKTRHASPVATPPMGDAQAIAVNQSQQFMAQMHDQQIVGSPIMSTQMVPPNPSGYMNAPLASSPRPPSMMQPPYMQQMTAGRVANSPQMHRAQMGFGVPIQNQMMPAGYQLSPQTQTLQYGTSPPMHTQVVRPTNIPEHVLHPQSFNAVAGPAAMSSQTVHFPTYPPAGGSVPQRPKSPVVPYQILNPHDQSVVTKMGDTNQTTTFLGEKKLVENVEGPSPTVADIATHSAAPSDASPAPIANIETTTDSAASTHAAVFVNLPNTGAKSRDEMADAVPAEEVPSAPEVTRQTPEKEDTAIRLKDGSGVSAVKGDVIIAEVAESAEKEQSVDAADGAAKGPADAVESAKHVSKASAAEDAKEVALPVPSNTPPLETESLTSSKLEGHVSPVPSAKVVVDEPEQRSSVLPAQTDKLSEPAASVDKSSVKSPEPQRKSTVSPDSLGQGSSINKDSGSIAQTSQSQLLKSQYVADKPVVNGVSPDVPVASGGKGDKNAEERQSTASEASKSKETSSTVESKTKTKEASSTHLASGEASSGKSSVEKTNGVPSDGKLKSAGSDITYSNDQWSPKNPSGKRHYDSNFLLQFQYRTTSLKKPKDLPNIDIVLEQPHKQVVNPLQPMDMRGGSDFIPNYMRGPGPRRPGRQNSRDQHRHSGRSSMSGPSVMKKVVSIDRDVELKTTANAWKPVKRDTNLKMPQEEIEILDIMRAVRAILNKLTPSTFPELMAQVLELKIDAEKKLRGTIDLIFEKAIDEPNFSEAYANMCRHMTKIQVTPEVVPGAEPSPAGTTIEFRKLLLTRCQREFEKNKSDQEHLRELKTKMEENTDTELAPQLKEEYELAEFKERRRTLGNIRFIGELFKLRMLTESIMHKCIMSLFKARDDDHLESLCRLLTTIGKDLDHPKGKQIMDQYFTQVKKIIQEKRTAARVRFMLQDLHDLRQNKWVPRAIQTQGPKTITQIHQDAKNEEQMLQMKLAATASAPVNQGGRQQGRTGSRGGHGEDGWTRVAQPAKPSRYDPNKMKLKPSQFDSTNVTLGPAKEFGRWKSGSAGSGVTRTGSSGYSPSSSMDRTPETGRSNTPTSMMNRFSALSQGRQGSDYDQRRQGGRQSSREGSRSGSRGSMGPPVSSGSGNRTPRRDERSQLLETTRQMTSSVERGARLKSSRESSPSVALRPRTPQQPPAAHQYRTDLDEEKMQQKSKNIMEEFLSIVDFKEATECIEELNAPPSLMHALVYVAHEFTLEKKRQQRTYIGKLMAHLLKLGRLSIEQYMKGLAELLEMAADYEIDVPMVWEYLAEQLAPVFEDEMQSDVPLKCLVELAAPLQEEGKSGIFVAEVIKAIIRGGNLQSFVARWQRSGLLWSKITGKDKTAVENFLVAHNLQDFSDSEELSRQAPSASVVEEETQQSMADEQYRLEQHITQLLENKASNNDIFAWVSKNVKEDDTSKPPFLRALTISICRSSIDSKCLTVDEDKISDRSQVLKKYIGTNQENELQALFALQHLMVILEQPANILRKLFGVLENEDVVSEQTFFKWEKSDDPNEQEGRGVAVASVNPFFTWLRTAEPESSD